VSFSIWDAAMVAVKTIGYAATLGAAGAVFFLGVCHSLIAIANRQRIRRMMQNLSVLSMLAAGAQILVTAGSMSGDAAGMVNGPLVHMVWQAGQGRVVAIRAIGLLLAVLGSLSDRPSPLAFVGAAMAATSFAWVGHAHSLEPHVLPILLLSLHLLGVAFWLGALAPLLIVSRNSDVSRVAATAARFGASAVFVVGGLIAAGLCLLWMLVSDFTAWWGSPYGRYVTVKLALVACLLCSAAFNKLHLTRRMLANDTQAVRRLCTTIRLEMILGAVILAVTATFTSVAGPPALT
jgi:copper resistance protein D